MTNMKYGCRAVWSWSMLPVFGLWGALNLAQGKIHFQKQSAGPKRAKQGSATVSPSIPWIWTSKHFQPFSVYILSKGNWIFRCARFSWSHFSHWVIHRFNFAHKESLLKTLSVVNLVRSWRVIKTQITNINWFWTYICPFSSSLVKKVLQPCWLSCIHRVCMVLVSNVGHLNWLEC